jgi:RNA polymerase sigma factor (sigma-70 family)
MTRFPARPGSPADVPTPRLIDLIRSGIEVERNFEQLYHRYRKRVWSYFARKGFSPPESDDLTQQTFFRVFRNMGRQKDSSKFEGWLFEIATNLYRNELRTWSTEKRQGAQVELDDYHASWDPDPLADAIEHERRGALDAALAELPNQRRRCALLRLRGGFRYREIAAIMGISTETVKAHLHHAIKDLKAKLGGNEDSEG